MTLKGNTVVPDKRKGMVYVYQSDDSLVHFCWKDRKTGTVEDDLIIFPDDCEFKKCTQCKDGSRVYLLKFKASSRKLFFWMQEPKVDADDDYVWKVNDALNGGTGANPRGSDSSENVTPSGSEADMQSLLGSMSQSQLMQLLGGMSNMGESGLLSQLQQLAPGLALGGSGTGGSGGGTATETRGSTGSSAPKAESLLNKTKKPSAQPANPPKSSSSTAGPIQLEDLQVILNRMQPGTGGNNVQVDLASAVNSESIRRITACPKTVTKLAPLLPQFGGPEIPAEDRLAGKPDEKRQKEVQETLQSPQFQNALSAFCAAFPSGQLGPLVSQFGMGADAVNAAKNGNLEAFLNAIQKEVDGIQGEAEIEESDMNTVD